MNLEHLLANALEFSEQIRVFRDVPLIRETAIDEAAGDFDAQTFADTNMIDTNTPVGSLLTTGGASRFHDLNWSAGGGVKQKNSLGGQFEVSQRFGYQNNNSTYFTPTEQGTARLTLRYTQPLLNGAGRTYNTSLITLAKIDAHAGHAELSAKLQEHLLEVTRAYWALYQQRAIFLQKARLLERSVELQAELESRARLDAVSSQLASARAAVAQRRTDLIRARAAILNAESRIRALVNSPMLNSGEIVPVEPPNAVYQPVDLQQAQMEALQFRPEVDQAARRVEAAKWREYMAKAETKSQLNIVTEAYASGLRGDRDMAGSWVDQFSVGAPSYSAGLYYERPLNNTAAMARLRRRQLETRQSTAQMRAGAELMLWEVEVAAREVDTSWREMNAQFLAMQAAAEELAYREQRWRKLPGEQHDSASALEHLLDSQQRLTDAENRLAESQVVYSLSLLNLEKAKGTLLISENITQERMQAACLPTLEHRKQGVSPDVLEESLPTPPVDGPAANPHAPVVAPPAENLPAPPVNADDGRQVNQQPMFAPRANEVARPNMAAPPSPVYVQAPFESYAQQTTLPRSQPMATGPVNAAPRVALPTESRPDARASDSPSGGRPSAVSMPATQPPAFQPPTVPPRLQPRRLPPVQPESPPSNPS
ncbi:MAG: TolC family protein, partial [Planctomycetales bacterium]|nr:TolC family protein [Planctomycetales bacterium]